MGLTRRGYSVYIVLFSCFVLCFSFAGITILSGRSSAEFTITPAVSLEV